MAPFEYKMKEKGLRWLRHLQCRSINAREEVALMSWMEAIKKDSCQI